MLRIIFRKCQNVPEYAGLFRKMPVNASGMDFTHKCRHFPNPADINTDRQSISPYSITALMEIKGFSQCIAANKQQACGLAAAASCGMVAAHEFFNCKLVLLLLVAATLWLLVAATLRLLVAATLRLIVCCNLAACAFFVCKLDFSLLVAACLLLTVAACLLQTAGACLLQTAASCN